MRKIMTQVGLGLALTVGAAGAVAAQKTRPDSTRPERSAQGVRGERGERGERPNRAERGDRRGGPDAALLKGITLTDAQKTRVAALRTEQRDAMEKNRERFSATMKEARDARQKGDTATARAKMSVVRAEMDRLRERQISALRSILTSAQQTTFDANVAAWQERAADRGPRGERGPRGGKVGR